LAECIIGQEKELVPKKDVNVKVESINGSESMNEQHEFAGIEVLADLYDCRKPEKLSDDKYLTKIIYEAIKQAEMHIVNTMVVRLGKGRTICSALTESSLIIHTYPEYGHCFVNIFTCGQGKPRKALEYLIRELEPNEVRNEQEIQRGK
jgi:S-adenosylmethionine decarboxylase proenzyme